MRLCLFLTVIILSYLGFAKDVVSYYENSIRHSLGFTNPNALAMQSLIISFEFILLYYNKKIRVLLIVFFFSYIVDFYSGSRTTSFILLIVMILLLVYKCKPQFFENYFVKKIIIHSYLLFFLITFIVTVFFFYGNHFALQLDSIMSFRLTNISYYLKLLTINLFGNDLSVYERTLDSSYGFIILGLGIIPTLLYGFLFNRLFKCFYNEFNYLCIIFMFCFMIYGLSERLWLNIDYNLFMIFFVFVIFKKITVITK